MWKKLLGCLAVCSSSFWLFAEAPSSDHFSQLKQLLHFDQTLLAKILSYSAPGSLQETNILLRKPGTLQENVIQKVLTTLSCADKYHVNHNHILTIIDYSIPSNKKRLWVFDLQAQKLLYYTYVSHGINSGSLETCHFSNKYNSKASSLGIYTTEKAYPGREGLSLRLDGLDSGFNDHASGRSIVMHGGWYLNEKFIQRYGRPGRSWGCPALPEEISKSVINTIKDKSLLIIYYPSEHWFSQSKFLRCENLTRRHITPELKPDLNQAVEDNREDIVYADLKNHRHKDDNDPVLTLSTDDYEQIFHSRAPVARMLRRQINHAEYVALTPHEIEQFHWYPNYLNPLYRHIYFIVPDVKIIRGYAHTQMRVVPLGPIKTIKDHMIFFETRAPIHLRATNHFIRWLGL